MTWADEEKITPGVRTMLEVNMGWQPGERLLVVTDVPRPEDWAGMPLPALTEMLERAVLARQVAEVARRMRPEGAVDFVVYPATGGHGAEPPADLAARLRQADVVIALTTYSLSHTDAREAATHAGVRLASMPSFLAEMFYPDGPMAVDYRQVAAEAEAIARQLTDAREAWVRSPAGTDIRFSLVGRAGMADTGLYLRRGEWGNLPAGEAYIAPVEGTAEGVLVVQAGWHPGLTEEMRLVFRAGQVVEVLGGGRVGEELRQFLRPGDDAPLYAARRNLAELGVGTNPNARRPDNVLEAEKIRGTVHIAVGDNAHMGGRVAADFHEDFVVPQAELWLDGKRVLPVL
jgi:leucyl aminopeptidase (aminopeptidase T)